MMGGKTPEICWAVNKRQDNKLKNCCIRLVIYLNCMIIRGFTNLKFYKFNVFGSVHLCTVQYSDKLMQLLIVFISYLIIHSTCFERHPLFIRSFLYYTCSLQLSVLLLVSGTVCLESTTRQCHGQTATQITGGCMYSKGNSWWWADVARNMLSE
jgi:hypothetical protein